MQQNAHSSRKGQLDEADKGSNSDCLIVSCRTQISQLQRNYNYLPHSL